MTSRSKWTQEEDKVLIELVKANPQNLTEAFRLTAKKINRSTNSAMARWYYLRREDKLSTCFLSMSEDKGLVNTKIVSSKTVNHKQYNLQDKLATFLHNINNIFKKWQQ